MLFVFHIFSALAAVTVTTILIRKKLNMLSLAIFRFIQVTRRFAWTFAASWTKNPRSTNVTLLLLLSPTSYSLLNLQHFPFLLSKYCLHAVLTFTFENSGAGWRASGAGGRASGAGGRASGAGGRAIDPAIPSERLIVCNYEILGNCGSYLWNNEYK